MRAKRKYFTESSTLSFLGLLMSFTTVWQAFLSGILNGAVYGLISVGLSMIFGVVRIVNFAHGEFLMVGMYLSYALWALLGLTPSGRSHRHVRSLLLRRGDPAFFLSPGTQCPGPGSDLPHGGPLHSHDEPGSFSLPGRFPFGKSFLCGLDLHFAGAIISVPRLLACLGAVVFSLLLALFLLRRTRKAMRAVAQDREVSMLVGINPERMYKLP